MRASQAGFTLIELLAALFAGSLLLFSLTMLLSSLATGLHKAERAPEMEAARRITPILSQMLENALPGAGDEQQFEGARDHLLASVPAPLALGPIGSVRLKLEVDRAKKGVGLFVSFEPEHPGQALPAATTQRRLIADGFRDIEFSYDPRADGDDRGDLPHVIRIHLSPRNGTDQVIAIEPRITATGACQFDPISMTCRA